MKKIKKVFLILIFAVILLSTSSNAATVNSSSNYSKYANVGTEKIYSYNSEIYIKEDSSMIVEETIQVYAAGIDIKRGIYRDFPTKYKDKHNNNYNVKFEVIEVLRDGKKEPYKLENKKNGVRVYIGDSGKMLTSGYYTYTIKYKTDRQLGYFEDHDELYWNVTGNGWSFAIDNVTAIVHLPDNANINKVDLEAYTGKQGSKEQKYTAYKDKVNNTVTFKTTTNLYSEEGLTIVVGFEKGIVHEPTFKEKIGYFFNDNKGIFIGLICTAIIIAYCFITWSKVGKDPKKDIIIPRYNPPEGLSPAELKYIESMGKYDKVFEASILNLAVKGYLKIESKKSISDEKMEHLYEKMSSSKIEFFKNRLTVMTLIKQEKAIENDLSEDEKDIYKILPDTVKLEYSRSLQPILAKIQTEQRKFLKEENEGKMYKKNLGLVAISVIMSIITLIISIVFSSGLVEELFAIPFMSTWLTLWTIGVTTMLKTAKGAKNCGLILNMIPFLIGELIGIGVLIHYTGTGIAFLILLLVIVNVVYAFLIKAYTEEGRRIKDEIEGFKLFIKTASEDEIKEQTPETFDKYFPYAYALGLENDWAKKFESVLEKNNYEPNWCTGMYNGGAFRATTFTSSFSSSLSRSISSASVHPSSSGGGSRRPEAEVHQAEVAGGRRRRRLVIH